MANECDVNWQRYFDGARGTYFAVCQLCEAVSQSAWNGKLPTCVVALYYGRLSGRQFIAEYKSDHTSLIVIDLSSLGLTGSDKRKDFRLLFATLLRASCQIMAQAFGDTNEVGDGVFINKSMEFGSVDNPCDGVYDAQSVAGRLIDAFVDEGFADGYDLNRFADAVRYEPVTGAIAMYSRWKKARCSRFVARAEEKI